MMLAISVYSIISLGYYKEMDVMIKKTSQDQRLPLTCLEDFEQLPEKPGVYYFIMNLKSNLRW
jgi:DNA polymerase-3 subunit epsilon